LRIYDFHKVRRLACLHIYDTTSTACDLDRRFPDFNVMIMSCNDYYGWYSEDDYDLRLHRVFNGNEDL
jgi:hypothetical protein